MKYGKKLLFLPFYVGLLLLLPILFVLAQSPTPGNYDVTVSPVFFDLTANPDSLVSGIVKVRNNTTSPIPLKVEVKRMEGDLSGNISLKQDASDTTLSWISFDNDLVTLTPLEWTQIPFKINIPQDAAYGYYFAITFTQANNTNPGKTGAVIKGAAAVPILLNVKKPGARIDGKLVSFKTDASFYEYLPTKFLINFQNTGNIHIRPKGNIFIKDFLGNQVATLSVNDSQGTILPNSAKIFESSWDDGFITIEPKLVNGAPKLDKNGKPETQLKISWEKLLDFRIGQYTAQTLLVLSTDTRDIPFTASASFFVFPWGLILTIIIILILERLLERFIIKGFKKLIKGPVKNTNN